ncbi:FecR domain-containing protein (plasmid) [Novosphingobium sp. BL-8A]|uniref:FecR family protein n=1 Tax=Novosphingobium sp. BL-8A TaxID=3127639 RepID=UPI003756B3E8
MTDPMSVSALDDRAAYWALRADANTLSVREQEELDAWIAADTRHAGAFARAMAANAYLERAVALGVERDLTHEASAPAEPVEEADDLRMRRVNRRLWLGGAAGAIAASVLAAVGLEKFTRTETLNAEKGSVRRAALADGSAVTLNSGTQVSVSMQPLERRVSMLAGEANFDVAKDAARPFIVEAGAVRIRVVGTSFLVQISDIGDVAVTVREGQVEVRATGAQPYLLSAGDRIDVPARGPVAQGQLSPGDVDRAGLWQRGEMDLTGLTLADAARQYARYSDRRILFGDPALGELKVAGVFSTSDPAGFAQAAALAHDLRVTVGDDTVTLSRK